MSYDDPVRLAYECKLLTDTNKHVRVWCGNSTDGDAWRGVLPERLGGPSRGSGDLPNPGDLTLSQGQLHIHLDQLSAPRYTEAMMSLCGQINALDTTLPEIDFRIRFHIRPRPEPGQK